MNAVATMVQLRPLSPYEPRKHLIRDPTWTSPEEKESKTQKSAKSGVKRASRIKREPELSHQWLRFLLNAILETQTGVRLLIQLKDFLTPRLYRLLEFETRRRGTHFTLGSMQICRPIPTAVEVSATARTDTRTIAIAARLDYLKGNWICTSFSTLGR